MLEACLTTAGELNVYDKLLLIADFCKLAEIAFDDSNIHHHVLLVGPKGTGKSISLVALSVKFRNDQKNFIYLSTNTLKSLCYSSCNEEIIEKHHAYINKKGNIMHILTKRETSCIY